MRGHDGIGLHVGPEDGFVAQVVFSDSLYESSVIAEGDEQLGPYEVQDQELVILQ